MVEDTIAQEVAQHALAAAVAARQLVILSRTVKDAAIMAMAEAILAKKEEILFRNGIDVEAGREAGLSTALIDRLTLNDKRINAIAESLREIAALPDPIGEILFERTIKDGALLQKVRVPLGVVGIIYESRPNVTVEAAALCIKAGNAVVLRGGRESLNSNVSLVNAVVPAAVSAGLPEGVIQYIRITDRQSVRELTRLDRLVDLIIARGSEQMVRAIREGATVPVLGHGKGLCHTYIDAQFNQKMAVDIAFNAKVHRPGVCNAMETLLVHRTAAPDVLPVLGKKLTEAGVELRGCDKTVKILKNIKKATEDDWSTEYLDTILSIRIVDSLEDAIDHITRYGSKHSEAIITDNKTTAELFIKNVDAACVMHNSSTRLHDGGVFGLGSEIGISTQKLHARGTMGIQELTTTKFVVRGSGQIR